MNRLSIGQRLALCFAAILLIALAITTTALWRLQASNAAMRTLMEEPLVKERLVGDRLRMAQISMRRALAIAKSSDTGLEAFFAADQKDTSQRSDQISKQLEPLLHSEDEIALTKQADVLRKDFTGTRVALYKLKAAGDAAGAEKLLADKLMPLSKAVTDNMEAMLDLQRKTIDRTAHDIDVVNQASGRWIMVLCALALVSGALCAWAISRSITAPISEALLATQRIAAGDLSAPAAQTKSRAGADEIGRLMDATATMRTSLADMIRDIRAAVDSILHASGEIATGNMDLSQRTEQTAANLQQTASSMGQLTSTVRQSSESARAANQLATSASDVAKQGGEVVAQVVVTMGQINSSSQRIADIIGVIDGIAFQTNILALNAAVEAARAGEQGRGFAVVAGEVRLLAQRSADAAKEIKVLIGTSVERVTLGASLVGDAGRTMDAIVASVRRVTDIMGEMTDAAAGQADGIGQMGSAVTQLDQMTQQNAALVEESTAATESLREQAAQLARAVSIFKLAA